MCGITGYTGRKQAYGILLNSLKRLEYRGYDSAGICIYAPSSKSLVLMKNAGSVSQFESITPNIAGTCGIAHTRWATCGAPTKNNAHPFLDCERRIAIVHNGIIENYKELKDRLQKEGHAFSSATDTEVVVHLIEKFYEGKLESAVAKAVKEVRGTYALVVICSDEPGKIVGTRKESPLIVGVGTGENFIASDVPAILPYTNRVIYLNDGDIAVLTERSININDINGERIIQKIDKIKWSIEDAEKGGYDHYMLKEIYEQPNAIHNSLLGRLQDFQLSEKVSTKVDSILMVGCGTSYHASLVGKYILESLVQIPVSVEIASEYRYSSRLKTLRNPLVIALTQSGETADTIAAVREARQRGCRTIAITNVVGSTITRETDEVVYTQAGPEIGVAATKTFTTQLIALYLLAMKFASEGDRVGYDRISQLHNTLRNLPRTVQNVLDSADKIEAISRKIKDAHSVFFIGRHINYPVALEGALKLKEISYIHAEGYPAGELKHGPLALLSRETPVIAIAVPDHTYEKVLSNIAEVSARDAPVIGVGYDGDTELSKYVDDIITVPRIQPIFSPISVTVAFQILSYYTAKNLGRDIDKPRNLAKSVTVE